MDKRTISADVVMRNIFEQKMGAFELLQTMEQGKHGICLDCRGYLKAPDELFDTGEGHYTDGPILCASCKMERNRRLSRAMDEERRGR